MNVKPLVATLCVALALASPPATPAARAQGNQEVCRTFAETGRQVCGRFLEYWESHGGLAQQGYPISGRFAEVSSVDGKTYTVQYFERAVFELHPENAKPYDVLLSLLGSRFFAERYPNGAPEMPPPMNPVAGRLFSQTGKEVRQPFLDYWEKHGGLAQQGYPISNPFMEKNEGDGKTYMVQYFERAVFELHSENAPPFNVLLSLLGTMQAKHRYPAGLPGSGAGSGGDAVAQLRARPLKLPTMAGGACPVSAPRQTAPAFAPGLGSGPVYPVGFDEKSVLDLSGATREGEWFLSKVLWVASPEFSGVALVRGGKLDTAGEVRFGEGASPAAELVLDTAVGQRSQPGWTDWPTYTRLRGSGCYAYQVDAAGFSSVIVFQAIQRMP